MTPDQIRNRVAEARELAGKASYGPWDGGEVVDGQLMGYMGDFGWYVRGPAGDPELEDSDQGRTDAYFIAASRELVPELCSIIEELQCKTDRLTSLVTGFLENFAPMGSAFEQWRGDAWPEDVFEALAEAVGFTRSAEEGSPTQWDKPH